MNAKVKVFSNKSIKVLLLFKIYLGINLPELLMPK
jgi:hypothetical protein